MYELARKIINECGGKICMHCLGRKMSKSVEGNDNVDRAEHILKELDVSLDDECIICENIFDKIDDEFLETIYDRIDMLGIEFDTFHVGSRIDKKIQKNDDELSARFGLDVEPIKKEINRIIGRDLENHLEKEVVFQSEDIVVNVDLRRNPKVRIQINPIFIEGRYNKLVRGIPQTKWPCTKCKGKGCEDCNFTGKQYPESVEELISHHVLKATEGYEAKFHGAGREDIDVLMLGEGRPFVLEIKEPRIRKIDLNTLEEKINKINEGKTAYHDLKFSKRSRKAEIKESSPDAYKVYEALVKCDDAYDAEKLKDLKSLDEIEQQTPLRVVHRRADKTRIKHVLDIECEIIDDNTFMMRIKTQGGLYIKELISGDEGRTKPNISEILGVDAVCETLDVIEVSGK